ncbi:hypothetical protein IGI04_033855 [Brassica rapa subsp. trilocularis]|uniref:EF-hand domain-containing protein n=1 Tax=Brassica rapa subsp. trilocularis TaxID=1813537 RepID=A0ABQ7L933_BRACM|nr:hypothetical protein IGI04_033855 [Brassica rapa subsp. trilocularis]
MSNVNFLELQYKLSKNKMLRKPSRLFSRDRQSSGLSSPGSVGVPQPTINEMRRVFNRFDSDKDGKISQTEYKVVLRALGQERAIQDVPKIFKAADLDGDGFIDFKEFIDAHKRSGGIRSLDIRNAFWTFDLNGDGKISAEEVMSVLRKLGERCNLEDCKRMVRAVDADGDGLVNMEEFMRMMTQSMNIFPTASIVLESMEGYIGCENKATSATLNSTSNRHKNMYHTEVMETFVVSHNQRSTNDFRHDLDKVVAVITHTEILEDCKALSEVGCI